MEAISCLHDLQTHARITSLKFLFAVPVMVLQRCGTTPLGLGIMVKCSQGLCGQVQGFVFITF
jgi:hypothetical protein